MTIETFIILLGIVGIALHLTDRIPTQDPRIMFFLYFSQKAHALLLSILTLLYFYGIR